jgi:hypothetical protein
MKQKIVILMGIFFTVQAARELVLVPYAYRSGNVHFLLSATPYKTAETIKDVLDQDDDVAERAAVIFSQHTNALWAKPLLLSAKASRKEPTTYDFNKSINIILPKLKKALERDSFVDTASAVIVFFEIPYVDIKEMRLLASSRKAWYEHNKLLWVAGSGLFVKSADGAKLTVKKMQAERLNIDASSVEQLNIVGIYKKKELSNVLYPSKKVLDKFMYHTRGSQTVGRRVPGRPTATKSHYYSNARLRRLRK